MKKILFIIILLCANYLTAQSQTENEGVKLDLLSAPSSPASNLLGIAPSEIDKPSDISAFMLSLQTASNSFTKLPSNYAVDIAPYWLFKKKTGDISTEGLSKSSGSNVFKETFVLSFAIRNTDSIETEFIPNTVYGGLGFKFSIFRGCYDAQTNKSLKDIREYQKNIVAIHGKTLASYKNNFDVLELQLKRKNLYKDAINYYVMKALVTEEFKNATQEKIEDFKRSILPKIADSISHTTEFTEIEEALEEKLQDLKEADTTENKRKIKETASEFQTARVGFTWDIAGGISAQFVDKRFDNSKVFNAGIWTTLGYTSEKFGAGLFLLRLLQNPDKIFAKENAPNDIGNITTFDFGGRYVFSKPQSKFSASLEGIYRSVLSNNTIDPSWRIVFNADYAIWENQKLTFSFGRNFDGTITKDGNLIAALTFLTGFGNKR